MKKLIQILCIGMIFSSCTIITKNENKSATDSTSVDSKELLEKEADNFIKNVAAMNYIEHAAVIGDTAYIGYPSRRGEEHSQDHLAITFLSDMKRGNFNNIYCCKIIDIARDHIWSDTLISGNLVGYAQNENN